MLTSQDIRRQFIDYFVEKHGHTFVLSSPVVPHDDPTLMFANAGMNQFKDVFLGTGKREYSRAANTQKCIRAGGKHNDLEDVGKDTYHHTFFEMLGNWSFGDYFKKEAIQWAWDLLTNVWGVDGDRLHATYFEGDESEGLEPDSEARELWLSILPKERVHPGNKKDNFWEMGDTGPCGPCSEIHYDATPNGDGGKLVNADDPRVIEIWNLVFIQFNRDASSKLHPLPARHVDTGMGFERITAVLQGKTSNYDTDIWSPLFDAISDITGAKPYGGKLGDSPEAHVDTAYRVIADHVRCLTFALTDGAVPSNEKRGYVLRRILRRAVRHGWQTLDQKQPFLHRLVPVVVDAMGEAFPELKKQAEKVVSIIKDEEESFGKTLAKGIRLFDDVVASALTDDCFKPEFRKQDAKVVVTPGDADGIKLAIKTQKQGVATPIPIDRITGEWIDKYFVKRPVLSGDAAFKLHDTYGFPIDLTQVMAEERGMTVDIAGYEKLMKEAQDRAREAGGEKVNTQALVEIVQKENPPAAEFTGYEGTELTATGPCLLFRINGDGYTVLDSAAAGDECVLVTSKTPFYAVAGGQVGDQGAIVVGTNSDGGTFRVVDTQRVGESIFHIGVVQDGELRATGGGDKTELQFRVDADRRAAIMANHTGTHILNRGLRKHVNAEADQKGSLVDADKLRFDFSHNAPVSEQQIEQVEELVNADIAADLEVFAGVAPVEQGRSINGLRAVFGEKYPPEVRIVSIGVPVEELLADPSNETWPAYSIEFCGGTHLSRTSAAKKLVIVSEEGVAKGVRRVTALTGAAAEEAAAQGEQLLERARAMKQAGRDDELVTGVAEITQALADRPVPLRMRHRIQAELAELQKLAKEAEKERAKEASGAAVEQAREIADGAGDHLIVARLDGVDGKSLRDAMDVIRKKRPEAALLLGTADGEKCAFIASVPKPLIAKGLKAGDWVREVAKTAGGGGGGRPDMAQAGGKDPSKLNDALDVGRAFAEKALGG